MKYIHTFLIGFLPVLLTLLGALAMIIGELDDAPGLVLLGIVIVGIATIINIKLTTNKLEIL